MPASMLASGFASGKGKRQATTQPPALSSVRIFFSKGGIYGQEEEEEEEEEEATVVDRGYNADLPWIQLRI